MYVRVIVFNCPALIVYYICFLIENASKWLDYPTVVNCGAVLALFRCCHLTEGGLPLSRQRITV